MRIGLLECDHVREKFQHIAGDYRVMFPALFKDFALDWVFYDVINGQFPKSVQECDAYICTGSRFSVYDNEPWIVTLKTFVQILKKARKPFVGICFGHQMLAEALGGKVEKAAVGWCVGVHKFKVSSGVSSLECGVSNESFSHSTLRTLNLTLHLMMMCQDQVQQLPEGAKVLASAADCPVAMMQIDDFMLGIQAHPEFTIAYEAALIEARIERIGAEKAEAALQTLTQKIDNQLTANWIISFIKSAINS